MTEDGTKARAEAAARAAVAALVGTASHLETSEWSDWQLDADFCAALDAEIFLCDGCGWWCEQSEMTGEQMCDQCEPVDDD